MSYFESRLPINFEDSNDVQKKLKMCEYLAIKNVFLTHTNNFKKISLNLKKKIEEEIPINAYYRTNLRINNIKDFKKQLKKLQKNPDIFSIESINKEVQLYAAKDSRVDIISFSDNKILKSLTPGVISLTKQNNSFIEFSLAPIMESNKVLQSKNFRNLYRFIHLANKLKANYIISGNFVDIYDFRHPRALISVCHTLLEIPLLSLKKIFVENPKVILEKARDRYNEKLEDQLKIIKGGINNSQK